jgi:hypothetical protein
VRGFKEGMKSADEEKTTAKIDSNSAGQTIEGEVKDKTKS